MPSSPNCGSRPSMQHGKTFVQRKRLGLALSGGGTRGLAHVGALQVLAETGVEWHAVAGTSVGSLVGAVLAAGKSVTDLSEMAHRLRWRHLARPVWPRRGFLTLAPLERFLTGILGADLRIEDLPLPYACVATDVMTGAECVFRSGRLAPRVRASCSVPGVFQPVDIDGRLYVDGGTVNNLPITPLQAMDVDVILAINLFGPPSYLPSDFIGYAMTVLGFMLVRAGDDPSLADVLVEPDLTGHGIVRRHYDLFVQRGREAMRARLPELLDLLA
ncbi:MAG: patatin-like phospholipase family protein [Caldilineae bacterium]|nr:MAG: patatin-like phospholipase family protein [Caldilineae bacterium]